jgi:hypothetical protein
MELTRGDRGTSHPYRVVCFTLQGSGWFEGEAAGIGCS